MDANASAMAEASRRAAAHSRKGGFPNAGFVVAAAEAVPAELAGVAHLVTVRFPWASLLRGSIGGDATVAAGVASLVADGGELELLLAPSARDGLDGVPTEPAEIAALAVRTFRAIDLQPVDARPATDAEIVASGSTWEKRLRSQHRDDRPVMLVRLVRP